MKYENLFRAIGQVDDPLIQEAEETKQLTFPAHPVPWRQWCALAAALVLVIGLGLVVRPMFQGGSSADSAAQNGESAGGEEAAQAAEEIQEEATQEEGEAGATGEPGDTYPGESLEVCFPPLTVTGPDSTVVVDGEAFETVAESENGKADEENAMSGESAENQSADKANGAAVLQTVVCGPEGALTLDFGENPPEQVTVSWYQENAWASGAETPDAETVADGVLIPPDSQRIWVAEVVALWTEGDSARYVFRVTPGA